MSFGSQRVMGYSSFLGGSQPCHLPIKDVSLITLCSIRRFVIITTDPNEAFSLASSRDDVCLVISDYYMPTLNGIELCYKLDRFCADKPKPFLFYILTGSVFKSIEAEGRAIGIDAFMYKPIDEDLLISCVTNAFLKASRAS